MDVAGVTSMVATAVTSVGSVLSGSLPAVLLIVAGLIGLAFLIRFIRRNVK